MLSKKNIRRLFCLFGLLALVVVLFCVFFDEAVLVRKGTVYRNHIRRKVVALTFDDGPSAIWTPKILAELKRLKIKATFFMVGEQVEKYPQVAREVAAQGHEIENHSYDHHVLIYYKMPELEAEVKDAERVIEEVTGRRTHYFRPPKSWLTHREKVKIKQMGYKIILWSLNSKDWVNFPAGYIVRYIMRRVRPGDILLFHDSGGVFGIEGGDRRQTLKAIPLLAQALRNKGFRFVTVEELLQERP